MAAKGSLYPPNPRDVPEDLALPSPVYRRQVLAVLCSLIMFLLIYVSLIMASFWLLVKAFRIFPLLAVPVLFIFLFLFKGLFKRHREDEEKLVEVTQEEQPLLFDFIYRVCEEVGHRSQIRWWSARMSTMRSSRITASSTCSRLPSGACISAWGRLMY
jgi:uncharacterized membrane protein